MADISKIASGTQIWNIKDATARNRMIDNTTNSDVRAIVNFLNGLKVNGNNVISQATADVVTVEADESAAVDVTVSTTGVAHFSFSIPKAKMSYISAFFSGNQLIFKNDDDYYAAFVDNECCIGAALT